MIEIERVSYIYPDKTKALTDITCSFTSNKIALLGSNGSGKSTLLQHINGLLFPSEGAIKIDSMPITKKTAEAIRKKVGFVFDNPGNQLFAPTVFEDVAFGPRNLGFSEAEVEDAVHDALRQLYMTHLKEKPPYNLSLGQKKKVAIAGVIAMQPKVIIFDEPFSGLDAVSLEHFIDLLDDLSADGHVILLSTHDIDIAYRWATECLLLHKGEMISFGPVEFLEDEQIMNQANLAVPTLYSLFSETNYRPKTVEEAKRLFSSFFLPHDTDEKKEGPSS